MILAAMVEDISSPMWNSAHAAMLKQTNVNVLAPTTAVFFQEIVPRIKDVVADAASMSRKGTVVIVM